LTHIKQQKIFLGIDQSMKNMGNVVLHSGVVLYGQRGVLYLRRLKLVELN